MRNFEKNIQQKASDFQMQPATDSFDKVMEALEKRKKRRFILWIWFVGSGLAIAAGIIIPTVFNTRSSYQADISSAKGQYSSASPITTSASLISQDQTIAKNQHNDQVTTLPVNQSEQNVQSSTGENSDRMNNQEPTFHQKNGTKHVQSSNQENFSSFHTEVVNLSENKRSVSKESSNTAHLVQENNAPENNETTNRFKDTAIAVQTITMRGDISTQVQMSHTSFEQMPLSLTTINRNGSNLFQPIRITTRNEFSRFSLGAYTNLGVMKSVFVNNKDSASASYTNSRTSNDEYLFSYSAGLQFRYSPFKFLSFETGIGYSQFRSTQLITPGVSASSLTSQSNPDTVMTLDYLSSSETKKFDNVYGYISIPLKVYYQKKWNWLGVEAGGGVIFDIPVHTYSYVADNTGEYSYKRDNVKQTPLNMFGLQVSANVHAVFNAKKFSFFAGPVFRYRVNSMFNDQYLIKQHYYFIGAETGIRYNF